MFTGNVEWITPPEMAGLFPDDEVVEAEADGVSAPLEQLTRPAPTARMIRVPAVTIPTFFTTK
jgi:hypothetical protein